MQWIGALLLAVIALLVRESLPPATTLLWAVGAGVAGSVALLLLYTGLASGAMGIVAPVAGMVGAIIPILVAAFTLGAPSPLQIAGFVLALVAVWLLAGSGGGAFQWRMLTLPILAGVGFGLFYVLMARAGDSGFWWPLVMARTTAGLVLIPWALLRKTSLTPPRALLPMTALVALFDTGGNLFYLLAAQSGRMDTAAVLSSLYPGVTVLLAWIVLKERLSLPQWAGVAAALVAIPLIVM
jgi:drug/metabolite transporter (DMT)-like permease